MAKTKTVRMLKMDKASEQKNCSHCLHNCDIGRCWLCWLFKSLIALFAAFLVLWMGFYLGMLSSRPLSYQVDPALNEMLHEGKFCMPKNLSRNLSTAALNALQGNMSMLAGKEGEAFDKEFLIQMITHHENGVEMAKLALQKSSNADIKALAQKIIDAQNTEIEQMKTLNK